MELKNVDLHIHTNCSDGQYSVDEVLQKAKDANLKVIGIVDHDTIKQFDVLSKSKVALDMLLSGYKIFAGVEFDCKIGNIVMHLIGYGINHKDEKIINLINEADKLRIKKLEYNLEQLKTFGIELSNEQVEILKQKSNVGRVDIAKCLFDNGVVSSIQEAFDKYLQNSEQAKSFKLEARKVIDIVKENGGMIVIAHPYQIMKDNNLTEEQTEKVWSTLVELGVSGMECYYSKYNIEKIKQLVSFAEKNNLNITMGSDFHGEKVKPDIVIGQIMLNE